MHSRTHTHTHTPTSKCTYRFMAIFVKWFVCSKRRWRSVHSAHAINSAKWRNSRSARLHCFRCCARNHGRSRVVAGGTHEKLFSLIATLIQHTAFGETDECNYYLELTETKSLIRFFILSEDLRQNLDLIHFRFTRIPILVWRLMAQPPTVPEQRKMFINRNCFLCRLQGEEEFIVATLSVVIHNGLEKIQHRRELNEEEAEEV